MVNSTDFENKKLLLEDWLAPWQEQCAVGFVERGGKIDARGILWAIGALEAGDPSKQYVYILLAHIDQYVPVYIGKAAHPIKRWKQHLAGFERGKSLYSRWWERLLTEEGNSLYRLTLLVVPVSAVSKPPIPGFPINAGAIEYQLVSLASDSYPDMLLNLEGKRR